MLEELRVILAAEAAARQQFEAASEESARLAQQAELQAHGYVRASRASRAARTYQARSASAAGTARRNSRLCASHSSAGASSVRKATSPPASSAIGTPSR